MLAVLDLRTKFGMIIFFFGMVLFVFTPILVAEPVSQGAEIYQEYCSVCHGDQGDGMTRVRRGLNPPPRDFTSRLAKAELTRERMLTAVKQGRTNTAMMSFASRLSEEEINAVVDHVRSHFMLKEEVALDTAMVLLERGKNTYTANCAVCHGDDGNGAMWTKTSLNPPPRDFTTLQALEALNRSRMITSVTHGRPDTAMMSFAKRLSTEDIGAVVDYIRTTFVGRVQTVQTPPSSGAGHRHGHAAMPSSVQTSPLAVVAADMALPFANGLVGDKDAGRQFYMENCFTCHGRKGDGNGPRSNFIRPKPRNFLHADSRRSLNRPALYQAISMGKPGTVMPAWSKVLSEKQIVNVAEFVFHAFIKKDEVLEEAKKKAGS
ncbi:hypothetical protein MNBD_GAMMA16-1459 [hydrothermal vent metagenome]|uniref:Cytochrome c domain-containing protein n=1 Tax=hydrothermal vent metagenome TaxID=652676 RepID=A0A3B0Z765_9ZZZZ